MCASSVEPDSSQIGNLHQSVLQVVRTSSLKWQSGVHDYLQPKESTGNELRCGSTARDIAGKAINN